jgi:phosphorylcholine metabolism protein LicD
MSGSNKLSDGNNMETAERMLRRVTRVLEVFRIPYWLEGGTQIGIVREGRLLPWDDDMDISIYDDQNWKHPFLVLALMLMGYRLTLQNHQTSIGPFQKGQSKMIKVRNFASGFKKGPVMLDIFIKRELEDNCFWVVGVKERVLKSTPTHFTRNLGKVQFKEKMYSIPEDFDGYLSYRYGDWKTPQKEWDFRVDDKAIIEKDYQ